MIYNFLMENNAWVQYANVFIPLGVSVIAAIGTFLVYKSKVDRVEKDLKEVEIEIKGIRDKVVACETSLKEREPLTRKKSPVTLTDRGNKILAESGGKKFVDDNYAELKKNVEDINPQTSYDIQEISHTIIERLKDDARINGIKDYLFKEGMQLSEIVDVLGIYLRDKILEERGIAVEDIDKHKRTG